MASTKHSRPVSKDNPRRAAAAQMTQRLDRQDVATLAGAVKMVQPRHRNYVMQRAAGSTPAQAWNATMTRVNNPEGSGRNLEARSPSVSRAIDAAVTTILRGSLMSSAQRRDWVLDRLLLESQDGGDSARIRALELLGKTAGLFIDRAEVALVDGGASVQSRIEELLAGVRRREPVNGVDAELDVVLEHDAPSDDGQDDEDVPRRSADEDHDSRG